MEEKQKFDYTSSFPILESVINNVTFINLSCSTKYLYCIFSFYSYKFRKEDGWFFRNTDTIIKDTNLSGDTIRKAKKELLKHGLIEIKRKYYENSGIRASDEIRLVEP